MAALNPISNLAMIITTAPVVRRSSTHIEAHQYEEPVHQIRPKSTAITKSLDESSSSRVEKRKELARQLSMEIPTKKSLLLPIKEKQSSTNTSTKVPVGGIPLTVACTYEIPVSVKPATGLPANYHLLEFDSSTDQRVYDKPS